MKQNALNFRWLFLFLILGLFTVTACAGDDGNSNAESPAGTPVVYPDAWKKGRTTYNDSFIKSKLSVLQFSVTRLDGTEPAFHNTYWDNHETGLYVDIISGEPLFSSRDKYDSRTGWPSFTKPLDPNVIMERTDTTYGMIRTEVRSKLSDSHLGHVFDDGPAPTGLRYCMNSASLVFIPVSEMAARGYGGYLYLFE